jgi:hypothetical protein
VSGRGAFFAAPGADASVTIEDNLIQDMSECSDRSGIYVHGNEGSHASVEVRNNIISNWDDGIWINGSGDLLVQVTGNTIVDNETGIRVEEDLEAIIDGNCIAGNEGPWLLPGGLTVYSRTVQLDATGNYWGDPSGPTHPDNPDGQGDKIGEYDGNWNPVAGVVDFSGWLSAHNCGITDLSIAGLEALQVVQDLQNTVPLFAGKPTVARVYADGGLEGVVPDVPVELKAYRNGALLGTLNSTVTAHPISGWDEARAGLEGGLAFRLQPEWLQGTLSLTVEVNPSGIIAETTYDNNLAELPLKFHGTPCSKTHRLCRANSARPTAISRSPSPSRSAAARERNSRSAGRWGQPGSRLPR